MKHVFLKTIIGMIFLTASSITLAQEDKNTYRHPLNGVSAYPNFGMSQGEIADAIAEEERLAQIEADKTMCLNESKEEEFFYNREGTNKFYYINEMHYTSCSNYVFTGRGYIENRYYEGNIDDVMENLGYKRGTQSMEVTYTGRVECGASDRNEYITAYYQIIKENKTENYDWCVNKGYETAN